MIIRTAIACFCLCVLVQGQEPQSPGPQSPAAPGPGGPGGGRMGTAGVTAGEPRPYDKVITKDAKSKAGVFTVHQVKDRYYYEIPKGELGKEFLWVTQIARTVSGAGYGGQPVGSRVIRWDRSGNKIYLRELNYDTVATTKSPIARAVEAANQSAILMAFPVAAFGKQDSAVIDVTRLFTSDIFEFSAKQRLRASTMDASRSFIERISAYPENIEAEASHTYTRGAMGAGGGPGPGAGPVVGMRPGSATVVMHYSMVRLPEKPMKPRLYDARVGYFSQRYMDFSLDEHRAPKREFIVRWRLEKKDPSAAVSEPVKPIVYYIDAATPEKWVPYMKRGVEKWQKAFEAAGFKNAVIAKMAPTAEEDPEFSPEDARYSVIRWLPSTVENAMGPNVHDPRTGEILDADIQFHHNVMNLLRDWYFVQVGPLDPRAQKLPLPDELMGKLVEFVCAHEVGHTLGFRHNMKASSMYPAEKIRDREWVKKMGHTPSIMDYSRFNYVAQPEDRIDPEDLIPGIGPYDVWATAWGYKPIDAATADAEKATLDGWAREQEATPWLRFSSAASGDSDPGELTEAVGDGDAIQSTGLGLKNLQRVAKLLMPATTARAGENYDDLAELYNRMLGQWVRELNHVAAIVGGLYSHQKAVGQEGVIFTAVPKVRQMEAVKFLNQNAFATPAWTVDREIVRRIEPVGTLRRIRNAQLAVLSNLLESARFGRLAEQQAIDGAAAYAPAEFLADVRKGIWGELEAPQVKVDAYRRNLQRAYLDLVNGKLNGGASAEGPARAVESGDEKPLYRAELRALQAKLTAAAARGADRETRAHLEASRDEIGKILDPKFAAAAGTGGGLRGRATVGDGEEMGCWVDLGIGR